MLRSNFVLSTLLSLLFGVVVGKLSGLILISLCVCLSFDNDGIFGICGIVAVGNDIDCIDGTNSVYARDIMKLVKTLKLIFHFRD